MEIVEVVIKVIALITAVGGVIVGAYKIFDKYKKVECYGEQIKSLDKKIDDLNTDTLAKIQTIMAEQMLQTNVLNAVLDGLEQLGCNHSVPLAKKELDDYINERAHKVEKL